MGKHKSQYRERSKEEMDVGSPDRELQQECSEMTGANDPSPEHKRKKKSKKVKKESEQKKCEEFTVSNLTEKVNYECGDKKNKKKKAKETKSEKQTDDVSATPSLNIEDSVLMAGQEKEHFVKKKKKKRKHKDNETIDGIEAKEENINDKQKNVADVSCDVTEEKKRKKTKKRRADDGSDEKQHKTQIESRENCNLKLPSSNDDGKNLKAGCNIASATTVGQWGSAEFEDTNRQNKFFRLLGGLKNKDSALGIQNKFQLGKNNSFQSGGGRAMDRAQQETYAKTLETDFQKALASNVNRGIGLGFDQLPSEGKKFHIDVNQSKSMKFDD